MKRYILGIMVLMVSGSLLWAMTADKEQKQVQFSLTQAIERGAHKEVVQFFLQNGADINAVDAGRTPISAAVGQRNEEVATFLVAQGADVNESYRDRDELDHPAPLLWVVQGGRLSLVKVLVAHGAHINTISPFTHSSVLMDAVDAGHADIVAFLLEQPGLDICYERYVARPISLGGSLNEAAFDIARHFGRQDIADMISDKIDLIKKKILWLCSLRSPEGLSQQEQEGWLEKLKGKIKRRILQIHTIDIVDANGNTSLHRAVLVGNYPLAFWILSIQPSLILRENKPILRKNRSEEEVSGETPLHCDVGRGNQAEFTRKFIEGCKEDIQKGLNEREKKKKADYLNG